MIGSPLSVWRAALAILRKELLVMFMSPMAWVFLATFQFVAGLLFSVSVAGTGEASLRPMLPNLAVTLLFCLPMVTMRAFAEESRTGTLELLLTSPIPLRSLVLGKWLAAMVLCGALLAGTAGLPLLLAWFGDPDLGMVVAAYAGLLLCCSAFAAVGLFASSCTGDQVVAAVAAVLILLPSWLASAVRDGAPTRWRPWLAAVAFADHLRSFGRGVIDTGDVAWFVGVTAIFLFLTWRVLESRRWR